jgi:hypothetical protein
MEDSSKSRATPKGLKNFGWQSLNLIQSLVPLLVILILLSVWFTTLRAEHHGWERFVVDLLFMLGLLVVLFFAEALEIAYTFLSDKNRDELGEPVGKFIEDMRSQLDLVYEAREWLVIIIIAMITLTAEHKKIYLPFVGEVHDLSFPVLSWTIPIPSRLLSLLFSLLFTTLPVIWFAQGPGKKIALSSSQQMIVWTRPVWWIIRKVGIFVKATGLNRPVEWIVGSGVTKRVFSRKESFSPSNTGFFLSCLQRYGFALHHLIIHIQVHQDGSCDVEQKFVLYLVRHPRKSFYRRLAFEESEFAQGKFESVSGYKLEAVGRKYANIGTLLDQIAEGTCPKNVMPSAKKHWDEQEERVKLGDRDIGVRAGFTTWEPVPSDADGAFAFRAEWKGSWKAGAFRVADGVEDDFEVKVDYPCKCFSLKITPDPEMRMIFTEVIPKVQLLENAHKGEELRLEAALSPAIDGAHGFLSAELDYPLPGANYTYEWLVRRIHD